ncbi:WD40-repeat-containing domain protein [Desarmillaria tabescens]|uniref:WD40-repeat-containing domain protein n=1 Tax=Armillaria tabescens TaxID=1929756 RepID=A0AA39JFF0_ARMTA|nr:WD40-repeat-containing domain protein [Desarmillaria tabescens]KAK0441771.1 WD40-repeat-containing domain protein [Desarmillaria tabescens]
MEPDQNFGVLNDLTMVDAGPSGEHIYTLTRTLEMPQGAVLCLGTTDDGQYLAVGGTGGITLWNLQYEKVLACPSGEGQRGATTVLTWVRETDEPMELLFFGTQNGHLVTWKQTILQGKVFEETQSLQICNPSEITCLDYDPSYNRLVAANHCGSIVLFSVESSLIPLSYITIPDYLPKVIFFGQVSGSDASRELLVLSLEGQIHVLRHHDRKMRKHKSLDVSGKIGNAAITSAKDILGIDDPSEGVALYRLQDGARVWTFPVPVRKSCRPRQVAFAEEGKVVVSGSDHGMVYVFDCRMGSKIDALRIDREDWVQTLATVSLKEKPCILAARSRELEKPALIFIWEKGTKTSTMTTILKPLTFG